MCLWNLVFPPHQFPKATAPQKKRSQPTLVRLHDKTHCNNKAMQRGEHTCSLTQLCQWTSALCVIATDVRLSSKSIPTRFFSPILSFLILSTSGYWLKIQSTAAVHGSCNDVFWMRGLVCWDENILYGSSSKISAAKLMLAAVFGHEFIHKCNGMQNKL